MTPEKISSLLRYSGIPQTALAKTANVNTGTLSLWLRGYSELAETIRDDINFAMHAMIEVSDESPFPLDWRQCPRLKSLVDSKIEDYRRARSAELSRQLET